jgi:hypothetical protein
VTKVAGGKETLEYHEARLTTVAGKAVEAAVLPDGKVERETEDRKLSRTTRRSDGPVSVPRRGAVPILSQPEEHDMRRMVIPALATVLVLAAGRPAVAAGEVGPRVQRDDDEKKGKGKSPGSRIGQTAEHRDEGKGKKEDDGGAKLPKAVADAVRNVFPGMKVVKAEREDEDGDQVFEVTLRGKGGTLEAKLTPKGRVVEVELKDDDDERGEKRKGKDDDDAKSKKRKGEDDEKGKKKKGEDDDKGKGEKGKKKGEDDDKRKKNKSDRD